LKIVRLRARNIGYSAEPQTLQYELVSNAASFEDYREHKGGWLGPVFCTLLEVETDDGARGTATAGAFSGAAKSVIDMYLPDLVLGADPRRHSWLWDRVYRALVRFGRRGPVISALSAFDLACWDLHGRLESKPVADLIGGRTRSAVPVYASRLYAREDPEQVAEEARSYLQAGFTRMKQRFGYGPADGPAGMRRNVELVRAVREALT
jgi:L-rhamnonate dehydratase